MGSRVIYLFLLSSILTFPQILGPIKQMTNLDLDARNAAFLEDYPWTGSNNFYYFFEGHKDSTVNIFQGFYTYSYFSQTDSFLNAIPVTTGNDSNINVKAKPLEDDSYLIIYQTNQNGNWDIAYKINREGVWSDTKFIAATPVNEINPNFLFTRMDFFDTLKIVYESEGSIYLARFKDSLLSEKPIFTKDDSTYYSSPCGSGLYTGWSSDYAIACVKKKIGNNNKIIMKKYENYIWGSEEELVSEGNPDNPKFISYLHQPAFSYRNKISDGNYSLYLILYWLSMGVPERVIDDLSLSTSKISTEYVYLITKKKGLKNEIFFSQPFSIKGERNDSTFTITNSWYYYPIYIPTKVDDCSPITGYLGYDYYLIFSTTWEDSIDGRIQLFSRRTFISPGDIKDDILNIGFSLSQNYPNPFNSFTKINFETTGGAFVKLEVYNLLGERVALQINNYVSPGKHESLFNGGALASGVYFYKLQVGDKHQIRKMQLLK